MKEQWKLCAITYLTMIALSLLLSCTDDRTTVIYGKVVDQNQRPVDSIMLEITGTRSFHPIPIQETFTNRDGEYSITLDVRKYYSGINVLIPYFPIENERFYTKYKITKMFRNGQQTNSCCFAEIGQKTRWDFELATK